jgi:hypothetical protein
MEEYLTKAQAANNSGASLNQIRYCIDLGYFINCIKTSSNQWLIPKLEVKKLKNDLDFIKESYKLSEVSKMLCCSVKSETVLKFFNDSTRYLFQTFYVRKDAIDNFIKNNQEIILIQSKNYLQINAAAKLIKKPSYVIHNHINKKRIKGILRHPLTKEYFIPRSEVKKFAEIYDDIRSSYSLNELSNLFNCDYQYIKDHRKVICLVFIEYKFIFKQYFFNKNSVDSLLNKLEPQNRNLEFLLDNILGRRTPVKAKVKKRTPVKTNKDTQKVRKEKKYKFNSSSIFLNNRKYLNITESAKMLCVKYSIIKLSIKKRKFDDLIFYNNQYWISLNELLEIKEIYYNSISCKDIMLKYNLNKSNKVKLFFPNVFIFNKWGQSHKRIPLSDIELFEQKLINTLKREANIKNEQNLYKLFGLLLEEVQETEFNETFSLCFDFFNIKINKTKVRKIRNYVFSIALSLKRLILYLNKEIYLYKDDELVILIKNSEFTSQNTLHISMFINFCKNKLRNKCIYQKKYNRYFSLKDDNSVEKIYSAEKWMKYYCYITNIDKHIEKAFANQKYSKMWLYTILHLSLSWRRSDILDFPPLNINDIELYNLEWFRQNDFTITQAQTIINHIKTISDTLNASKNRLRTHFIILPYLVIPTAIAFLIAEMHRVNNDEASLFGNSKFFKVHFAVFFENNDLKDFSNTKANRTLLSLNFNNAVNIEGMTCIAYSLSSYLRSHKIEAKSELAPTTAQYIFSTNQDGDIGNIAHNLFLRGHFGWLYHTLLKLAGKTDSLSMNDMTNSIINIRNEFSPYAIEAFSGYINSQYNEQKQQIKELMLVPKREINTILFAVSKGEMPSKSNYTQCLKYKNCPYKNNINCIGCKYSIPTNYSLIIVNNELKSLIKKLSETENEISKERLVFQIFKLLSILNEAKKEFDIWDKDYLSSFIDLEQLKKQIDKLGQKL